MHRAQPSYGLWLFNWQIPWFWKRPSLGFHSYACVFVLLIAPIRSTESVWSPPHTHTHYDELIMGVSPVEPPES